MAFPMKKRAKKGSCRRPQIRVFGDFSLGGDTWISPNSKLLGFSIHAKDWPLVEIVLPVSGGL